MEAVLRDIVSEDDAKEDRPLAAPVFTNFAADVDGIGRETRFGQVDRRLNLGLLADRRRIHLDFGLFRCFTTTQSPVGTLRAMRFARIAVNRTSNGYDVEQLKQSLVGLSELEDSRLRDSTSKIARRSRWPAAGAYSIAFRPPNAGRFF